MKPIGKRSPYGWRAAFFASGGAVLIENIDGVFGRAQKVTIYLPSGAVLSEAIVDTTHGFDVPWIERNDNE